MPYACLLYQQQNGYTSSLKFVGVLRIDTNDSFAGTKCRYAVLPEVH